MARELTGLLRHAPAICPKCGAVFRSDVPLADPPWITPVYRSAGGVCPRCSATGRIPSWVYRFHAVVEQCRQDASDPQRRAIMDDLEQHLRRHRTAKKTQAFIGQFRGPWRPLLPALKAAPPQHRRAQLTFLSWLLADRC